MFPRYLLRLVIFVALLLWLCMSLIAQASSASVGDVTAVEKNGAVRVEIAVKGDSVRPRISRLSGPDRIVLDFFGAIPDAGYRLVQVNKQAVAAIRTALFREGDEGNRPVTRVVIDLGKPVRYESASESGKFVLIIFDQAPNAVADSRSKPLVSNEQLRPAVPSAVPGTPASESTGPNKLNDIQVSQGDDKTSVVLTFDRPAEPHSMRFSDPARFVMDFRGVAEGADSKPKIEAKGNFLKSIRTSQFKEEPKILRVVLDEITATERPSVAVQGNKVVVQYSKQSSGSNQIASAGPPPNVSGSPIQGSQKPGVTSSLPHARAAKNLSAASSRSRRHTKTSAVARDERLASEPAPYGPGQQVARAAGVVPQVPSVTYANGLLTIDSKNSTLTDILFAVGEKTGAKIDLPFSDGMLDQIVFKAGPGRPRDVLATMLEGSAYNYYIVENSSGGLDAVTLVPK